MKKYFVFIFALAFLLVSYIPNFYEASVIDLLPSDRTMIWGEHIYTYDYNVYLSKIRQGQEGRWTIVDKYDNHPHQKGVLLQMIYLLAGKLTAPFNLSPVLAFHLLRTVTSFLWIYTIIWLAVFFLKKPALYSLGVVLSLLTASFPVFYRFDNSWWVRSYMSWWQEMDVVKRISFLPHDTLNYTFILVFTILLTLIGYSKKPKYFLFLCLGIFISMFIHPSSAIVFFFSWMIYNSIKIVWLGSFTKKKLIKIAFQTIIITIVIFIPLLYIKTVTADYPWKALVEFDKNNRLSLNITEYILALGPIFFSGSAGIILVLIKKQEQLLSVVTWFLGAWMAIFIFKFFPSQSELRFIQTANHIPLAILSAWFFFELWKKNQAAIKSITVIILITIILNGLVQTYFSVKAQNQFIFQRAVATMPLVPYPSQVMYPLKDFYNGLKWLELYTPRSTIVLSKYTAGNYIPAYSGNFVYLGHNPESSHFNEKAQRAEMFFSGNMSSDDAFQFLQTERINYVFYGPQEKENPPASGQITNYKFLVPVYQTSQVTIFKVKR